ncbi:MAG: hypothetical protein PHY47_27305 [Lachnospiraceae bacterium]|nr:hypothetical protein [Lachnospiraceae bacterium]
MYGTTLRHLEKLVKLDFDEDISVKIRDLQQTIVQNKKEIDNLLNDDRLIGDLSFSIHKLVKIEKEFSNIIDLICERADPLLADLLGLECA